MGLHISIVLSIHSLHFKRKVKKLNVKTSSASICHFQFYDIDTKNSILISSLIGNPCNPKQYYKPGECTFTDNYIWRNSMYNFDK